MIKKSCKLEGNGTFRQDPNNVLIKDGKFSDKQMTLSALNFWIMPLFLAKEKFTLMKKRNDFELIKILAQTRARINFFFLYNMIDQIQVKDVEDTIKTK